MRVALSVGEGEDASVLMPDDLFYSGPVRPGDPATLVWAERDAHALAEVA
ncbi:TOBE domain-containing protein [Serratia ureilytica]